MQLPDAKTVRDIRDIVEDDSIDTVVEVMGGCTPAYDYVRAAIEAGKNVVTANKALVCTFYDELLPLVQEKGVCFRCTAAVGGGIGWLSELERARRVPSIREVGGIMNGTCNYILDNMTRQGLNYDDVLKQAQALGYAEANPSTDVDGIDTWHKVILSANIAFGVSLDKETVPVAGIRNIKAEDVENFKAHGLGVQADRYGQAGKRRHQRLRPAHAGQRWRAGGRRSNELQFNHLRRRDFPAHELLRSGRRSQLTTAYNVVQDLVDVLAGKGFYAPLRRWRGGCERREADMVRSRQLERRDKGALGQHGGDRAGIRCRNARMAEKENPNAFAAAIRGSRTEMTERNRNESSQIRRQLHGGCRPVPQGTGYPSVKFGGKPTRSAGSWWSPPRASGLANDHKLT